ncbi:hypothetical protein ACWKWU_09850 [Chitinophaga lutea]
MEPFTLTIDDTAYEVQPYARGYQVSFHVESGDSKVVFELDEEDNLRALVTGAPLSDRVIEQLAEGITRHFGGT